MERPIIIAIVGESGAGKTTLALMLERRIGIPQIVSCTTRPMRFGEIDGREHWFVPASEVPAHSEMLAYTVFGGYEYWAHVEQVENICTYVLDERGLIELKEKWGEKFRVIAIKIVRPDNPTEQSRKARDAERVPYSDYDDIIINSGTLAQFYAAAADHIFAEITHAILTDHA